MGRWLEARRAEKKRRERKEARETRLEDADIPREVLDRVSHLAAEIMKRDPQLAEQFEIEALLDRYVDLAILQARTRDALYRVSLGDLARARRLTGAESQWRREIAQRRIAQWERCRQHLSVLDDELAAITELLCLIASRAVLIA